MSMFIELEPGDKEILILVPEFAIDRVRKTYIEPLKNIPKSKFLIGRLNFSIEKPTVAIRKDYMDNILKGAIEQYGIKKILVADGEYFKTFTKQTKADVHLGYELPLRINKNISVMYIPNFFRIFYQPEIQDKITFVLNKLNDMYAGAYIAPGEHIIHSAKLITLLSEIQPNLDNLKQYPKLTADIETFSLKHNTSGIASIAFAWDEHNGIAIQIDNGTDSPDEEKRALLRQFFTDYSGTFIWHNISFDAYALIYQLWMKDQTDIKGLLEGMSIMLKNWEDTRLITYLATNSCSRVSCALKDLAQEFGGNYAFKEIRNVAKALKEDKYTLLTYNLKDALCTWYVYKKYYPKMLSENQNDIYESIFKPAIKDIIQMQLTGLPLNMERVKEVKDILKKDRDLAIAKVNSCNIIQEYNYFLNEVYVQKKNAQYKQKQITLADAHEVFNPMSGKQKAELLYNFCGLVPEEFTNTGQPSTDSEALTNLLNKTDREDIKTLLSGLLELSEVVKILNTFIIAFEKAIPAPDGWHYLCGNFNLGGTVSGRLSSNGPNLQNLPATGTKYAKLIKSCFQAPKNKLFIGLDYASLEDRISALTTRDPNKLKVYTEGYDGHCLRAYSYYEDQMPDIKKALSEAKSEAERVNVINSIKTKYKALRQASKGITFALTYAGTWRTLVNKFKISEFDAKNIERKYHELYRESDIWVQDKLKKASICGFVEGAFGLRVRTPLLAQSVKGNKATPHEVDAEGRTAGNALGQSWCLLNSRAASEFMNEVRNHPVYKYKVHPCAQIHDAQYYLIDDDIDLLLWINEKLVHAINWQEHPDIANDKVKLEGNLSIFYPDWGHEIEIENNISKENFIKFIKEQQ